MIKTTAVWLFVDPFSNSVEHVPMDLEVLVAERRVMKNTYNVIHHLINRYSRVLPSIENTTTTKLVWFNLNYAYLLTVLRIAE